MGNNFVEIYEKTADCDIVAMINGGKYELLQVIINRYLPMIMHYVGKYCNVTDREDAIQEATLALYYAVKNYDKEKSTFSSFAALCIKRSVIGNVRYSNRKKNIPEELISSIDDVEILDNNSPEKIFFDREDYKNLTEDIKLELSGLEYKVLELFLSGRKYSDIAEILSISEKSVDNSLARIRKKLRSK